MRIASALAAIVALAACFKADVPDCTVACATDSDCPADLACSTQGTCSAGGADCTAQPDANETPDARPDGDPTNCAPDSFFGCADPDTATYCNSTGDGTVDSECGAPGCNETAGRCNECVPSGATCASATVLELCDGDGLEAGTEECALSCLDAPMPHCEYLSPQWLPDICDTPATVQDLAYAGFQPIDTTTASSCDMTVAQAAGPQICVLRANRINFNNTTVKLTGTRIAAFVADSELHVHPLGIIDVSADHLANGPGGGSTFSGAAPTGQNAGGGAGFLTNGAHGGNNTMNGGAMNGGSTVNPIVLTYMSTGPRPPFDMFDFVYGGGGGGGLLLIACRGTVTHEGTIDAGGGGGDGGRDVTAGPGINTVPGGGGGAGGYIVIQGARIVIQGGQLYANGGGGGGGTSEDDDVGGDGGDGPRSTSGGAPGIGDGGGGDGGTGGRLLGLPTSGQLGGLQTAGGGGGAAGRIQFYDPAGVSVTLSGATFSPPRDTDRDVTTR